MKEVLLDANFIISCVQQKIDFFEQIYLMDLKLIIPSEVIDELKKIKNSGKKLKIREAAMLSLEIIKKNKFKRIKINEKNVDKGIKKLAEKNPNMIIATLDKDIKKSVSNPKLVIRGKKRLKIL